MTFVELTPRQLAPTVGIATTGFCYPGGILQVFIDKISKFCSCQQQRNQISDKKNRSQHHHLQITSRRIIFFGAIASACIGFIGQLEYLEAIKENKNTLNSSFVIDWFRDPRKKPTSVKLKESPRYREKSYSS
jgi:hypothetical protein